MLRLLNGFFHLFESRPAFTHPFFDGMVRVEHDVDVFFKQFACLFELFKRQAAEINAFFDTSVDKLPDDFVRLSERHALFRQIVGKFGGI